MVNKKITFIFIIFSAILQLINASANKQSGISPVNAVMNMNKLYFIYLDRPYLSIGETNISKDISFIPDKEIEIKRLGDIEIKKSFFAGTADKEFFILYDNILYIVNKEKEQTIREKNKDISIKTITIIKENVSRLFLNGNDCFYLTENGHLFFYDPSNKTSTELQIPPIVIDYNMIVQLIPKDSLVNLLIKASNNWRNELWQKSNGIDINQIINNKFYFDRYFEVMQNVDNTSNTSFDDWIASEEQKWEEYRKKRIDIQDKYKKNWNMPEDVSDDINAMNPLDIFKYHPWIPLNIKNNLKIDDEGNILFEKIPFEQIDIPENKTATGNITRFNSHIDAYNSIVEFAANVQNYSPEAQKIYLDLRDSFANVILKYIVDEVEKFNDTFKNFKLLLTNLDKEFNSSFDMKIVNFEERNYNTAFDYVVINKAESMDNDYVLVYKKTEKNETLIKEFEKIGQQMSFIGLFGDYIYTVENGAIHLFDPFTLKEITSISDQVLFSIGHDIFLKYNATGRKYSLQKLSLLNEKYSLTAIPNNEIYSRNDNKKNDMASNRKIFWSAAYGKPGLAPLISINVEKRASRASVFINNNILKIITPGGSNIALSLEDL